MFIKVIYSTYWFRLNIPFCLDQIPVEYNIVYKHKKQNLFVQTFVQINLKIFLSDPQLVYYHINKIVVFEY